MLTLFFSTVDWISGTIILRPHEALDYATPDEVYRACFSVNGAA